MTFYLPSDPTPESYEEGDIFSFQHGPETTNVYAFRILSLGRDGKPEKTELVDHRSAKYTKLVALHVQVSQLRPLKPEEKPYHGCVNHAPPEHRGALDNTEEPERGDWLPWDEDWREWPLVGSVWYHPKETTSTALTDSQEFFIRTVDAACFALGSGLSDDEKTVLRTQVHQLGGLYDKSYLRQAIASKYMLRRMSMYVRELMDVVEKVTGDE